MNKISPRPVTLVAMIFAVGIFRIVTASSHSALAGFTPLGAMALFSGFYFQDKWKSYLFPLLTLWLSDIVLNRFVYFEEWVFFYNGFAWVYISFACLVLVGQMTRKVSVMNVVSACISGALIHWLISDFGVWLMGCTGTSADIQYTHDIRGLMSCYYMALPSLLNFLIGNLAFSVLLFGGFETMQRKFPLLRVQNS